MSIKDVLDQVSTDTQDFGQKPDVLDHTRCPRRREFPREFSDLSTGDLAYLIEECGWTRSDIADCYEGLTAKQVFERLSTTRITATQTKEPELTGVAKQLWEMDPDDWQGGRA